jgi:DNA invertase Pin-like site-specific DNA recombinase
MSPTASIQSELSIRTPLDLRSKVILAGNALVVSTSNVAKQRIVRWIRGIGFSLPFKVLCWRALIGGGREPSQYLGRDQRPGFAEMMKAVARREFDMVAAWSVDRLGRSLTDLLEFLKDLHAKRVDLFLHQQGLDTSTPSGRAMFQMMGVFAEFERAMIRERVLAGIARARSEGRALGRKRLEETDAAKVAAIRTARAEGLGLRRIATDLHVGVGTVLRVLGEGKERAAITG